MIRTPTCSWGRCNLRRTPSRRQLWRGLGVLPGSSPRARWPIITTRLDCGRVASRRRMWSTWRKHNLCCRGLFVLIQSLASHTWSWELFIPSRKILRRLSPLCNRRLKLHLNSNRRTTVWHSSTVRLEKLQRLMQSYNSTKGSRRKKSRRPIGSGMKCSSLCINCGMGCPPRSRNKEFFYRRTLFESASGISAEQKVSFLPGFEPIVQSGGEDFDFPAILPHLYHRLQRLVDLLLHLLQISFVPRQDERFQRIRRLFLRSFQFHLHLAELESEAKARAVANDAGNTDSSRGLKLDFHRFAGQQVDPTVEFHARPA